MFSPLHSLLYQSLNLRFKDIFQKISTEFTWIRLVCLMPVLLIHPCKNEPDFPKETLFHHFALLFRFQQQLPCHTRQWANIFFFTATASQMTCLKPFLKASLETNKTKLPLIIKIHNVDNRPYNHCFSIFWRKYPFLLNVKWGYCIETIREWLRCSETGERTLAGCYQGIYFSYKNWKEEKAF